MLICNGRSRWTQERKPAHTGQCQAIQRYEISQYFEIGSRQNWFTFRFLRRSSLWCSTDSCGQISFITLWVFVFISANLSIKHHIFRTLLTSDKYRYQARKWNIVIFYLLIPKHLIIQLVKYQIDILNLNTTFWHCKKISITFEQGCSLFSILCIALPIHLICIPLLCYWASKDRLISHFLSLHLCEVLYVCL